MQVGLWSPREEPRAGRNNQQLLSGKHQMPGMKNWGTELFSSWLLVLWDSPRASS